MISRMKIFPVRSTVSSPTLSVTIKTTKLVKTAMMQRAARTKALPTEVKMRILPQAAPEVDAQSTETHRLRSLANHRNAQTAEARKLRKLTNHRDTQTTEKRSPTVNVSPDRSTVRSRKLS